MVYGVERHFQQYFSNIMTVSFIGGGNQSTWRKPLTSRKLLNFFYHIMLYRVHLVWTGFELTNLVVIGTDCICSYSSNYNTVTTMSAPITIGTNHLTFREAICFSRTSFFFNIKQTSDFIYIKKFSKHCSNFTPNH